MQLHSASLSQSLALAEPLSWNARVLLRALVGLAAFARAAVLCAKHREAFVPGFSCHSFRDRDAAFKTSPASPTSQGPHIQAWTWPARFLIFFFHPGTELLWTAFLAAPSKTCLWLGCCFAGASARVRL